MSIWMYVGKGYSYDHEYIGPIYNDGDVAFIWTTYYRGERIDSGTTGDHRNFEEVLSSWVTHSRDRLLKSILDDKKQNIKNGN